MRIAIVGAGGVGGTLAVRLAGAGHEVWLSARGDHAAAIRGGGRAPRAQAAAPRPARGPTHLSARAPPPPPPAELLVMAVKAFDLEEAADGARALLPPSPAVLPLQNGIDAAD